MIHDAKLTKLDDGRVRVQIYHGDRLVADCTTQGLGPVIEAAERAIAAGPSRVQDERVGVGESVVCVVRKG